MSRRDHHALQSYLTILMQHIIKWQTQPMMRSKSWLNSIAYSRKNISALRENMPSLTDVVVQRYWEQSFQTAKKSAEREMNQTTDITSLSWQEVFEEEYTL
jgi:hypothetical protein